MKKVIMLASVAAMALAMTAAPALAGWRGNRYDGNKNQGGDVEIKAENDLYVRNDVESNSNTGYNEAEDNRGSAVVRTGVARSDAVNTVKGNSNDIDIDCDCVRGDLDLRADNDAVIWNDVEANANTGKNEVEDNGAMQVKTYRHSKSYNGNSASGRAVIETGNATATTDSWTDVNYNVIKVR